MEEDRVLQAAIRTRDFYSGLTKHYIRLAPKLGEDSRVNAHRLASEYGAVADGFDRFVEELRGNIPHDGAGGEVK